MSNLIGQGTTKNLPWAVILCRFKGSTPDATVEEPIERFYREAFTPGSGGLVEYWRDVSLGVIDITGSKVFGWVEVEIPRDKAGGSPTSVPPGPGRSGLINYAVNALKRVAWNNPIPIAANPGSADPRTGVAAVSHSPGVVEVFWVRPDGMVFTNARDPNINNGNWNQPIPIAANPGSADPRTGVAAVSHSPGVVEVFWVRPDGMVFTNARDPNINNGNWNQPIPIAANPGSADPRTGVAAVSHSPGVVEVFWVRPDGMVFTNARDPNINNGNWNQPIPIAANPGSADPSSGVAVVSHSPGVVEVFWVRPDGMVFTNARDPNINNGNWNQPIPIAANPGSADPRTGVAAVSHSPGVVEVFWVRPDGMVFTNARDPNINNGNWNQPIPIAANPGSADPSSGVAAVSHSPGVVEVFWVRPDGMVFTNARDPNINNGNWNQPIPIAANPGSADPRTGVAAVSHSPGVVEVFWVRPDGMVFTNARDPNKGNLKGFLGPIAVYTQNWSKDGAPAGADWSTPGWFPFWIDGGADGSGRVGLTPPHNGNITAHEMGHVFGMDHDVGPDLMTSSDYSDPCCIMSQNGPFIHPTWRVNFGPSVCLPHLMQRDWMYKDRVYYDDGQWLSQPDGITLPLAPISRPIARANLGIRLAYTQDATNWDYYLEYVIPTEWNRGVPGAPLFFIRRIVSISGAGDRPAYLGFIKPPTAVGTTAEFVEPSGNVRFRVELTDLQGPILKVNAKKL